MRPNSRGTGTANGQPPGTGAVRPGSGRRLRTGMAVSGPGNLNYNTMPRYSYP